MRTVLHACLACIFLMITIWSCTYTKKNLDSGDNRRDLNAYYIPSDVVKYLLPEVPTWANISLSGACHRLESVRYFDVKEVSGSYNISYFDILQAQINFNQEKQNVLRVARLAPDLPPKMEVGLPPKQEELLFYQALDRAQAKFYSFKVPTFKRINFLWIDPLLVWSGEAGAVPTLKPQIVQSLLNHNWAQSGHPVIISFCLTSLDLEKFLEQEKVADHNIRILGADAMTPFRPDLSMGTGAKLFIEGFFAKEQELHLYSRGKKIPLELEGTVTLHDF
ncbi:MAG: hypothetical protein HYV97_05215 [Bdellovibrio sp.]|nr:hypothetical protein [Bdellovibrio sp.]